MKRVAFVLGNLAPGGAERQALDLARRLRTHNWEVVFLLAEHRGDLLPVARREGFVTVDLRAQHWLPKSSPAFWLNIARVTRRIMRAARQHRCDIIQSWSFWEEVLALPAARLAGRAAIATRQTVAQSLQSSSTSSTNPHASRSSGPSKTSSAFSLQSSAISAIPLHYRIAQSIANHCTDAVVGCSPAVCREIRQREHLRPRQILCIPNAVDPSLFSHPSLNPHPSSLIPDSFLQPSAFSLQPSSLSSLVPSSPPLTPHPLPLLFIGSLAHFKPGKRHDILLRAFAIAHRELPHLRLALAGADLGTEPKMRALAQEIGIADAVHFAGAISQPERFLAALDIFALASDYEGLPVSVLEAMAARLPVVATRVTGCEDAVAHGKTGLLVPLDDPAAFARALIGLARDSELRARMGRCGERRVRRHFSLDVTAARYAQLYNKLTRS